MKVRNEKFERAKLFFMACAAEVYRPDFMRKFEAIVEATAQLRADKSLSPDALLRPVLSKMSVPELGMLCLLPNVNDTVVLILIEDEVKSKGPHYGNKENLSFLLGLFEDT